MPNAHQNVLAAWVRNSAGQRKDPDSLIHSSLVQSYPDHHITRTNASKCDVLGFARAGFAEISPLHDETGYQATRIYRPPPSRIDDQQGKLEDVVNFAKWAYSYKGADFVVYEVTYENRYMQTVKLQFILALKGGTDQSGLHQIKADELLLACGMWTRNAHEQVWVYDDQMWSKSSSLWKAVQGTTWDDVVLEPAMRAKLHRDVHGFFDNREVYRKAHIAWKRGIILHGKPGNGKSMTLAVTINELAKREPSIPSLYVKSLDACSGPKWSLQEIFKMARKTAPCLLVLEDLDSLVTDNTRSYFLNEVDGLESNDGILIIGSTNHLDRLDTSVTKRPSRFDRKYHFKLPQEAERLAYCRYWRKKFAESDNVELSDELCQVVAKWTEGYSFAYLKELFVTSLLLHTHGDDDEDVSDNQVNGTAEMAKYADAPVANSEAKQSPKTSDEKPETDQSIETNGDVSKKPNGETKGNEKPAEKRKLPEIEVPESLKGNSLTNIFRTQAQTLLEEMDHSADSGERKTPAAEDPPIKYRLPSLLDDEDE